MIFLLAQAFLISLSCVNYVQATCTDDQSFEFTGAYTYTDSVNVEATATGYLLEPSDYHVPDTCTCGVIKQWQFYAKGSGAIQLQVWKRLASNSYILMGENYYTVPPSATDTKIEYLVPQKDRITVRNGDLLAWYTGPNVNIVAYTQGTQDLINSPQDALPDGIKMKTGMSDSIVGETFDWNSGSITSFEDTVYAFGATLSSNNAPAFTNLPHKVVIYPSWVAGSVLYTVTVDDLNSQDVSSLQVTMADDITGVFQFSRSTYNVYLLTSSPQETSVDTVLTFTVSDQCGNSNTGQLSIEVRNELATITNMPQFFTMSEETTKQVLLASIAITDGDDLTFSSTTFNINPDPTTISLRSEGTEKSKSIYSDAGAVYDYTTNQMYIMDLTVNDGTANSNTGYALLYITKNDPPKITNLGPGAYLNASFVSTTNGATLYTIETTDAESDQLTYSIVCDPSTCPIDTAPKDGVIRTTADFQGRYEPGYDLVITVQDEKTTIATKTLTILVQDITYRPQITNLPIDHPILVSEGTALGTVIYKLSYIDLDTTETHTIYAELDPGWAWNYFTLNPTNGVLTTANNVIDYEFLDTYTATLTLTVTDSFGPTSATISLEFGNINEAPYFRQTKYTLEPVESATSGTNAGDPRFEIFDPDGGGETHEYTWDCGETSRYFTLDKTTAAITYAIDFDLDDVNITVPFTCTVTVTDQAGLSGTTLLEIDVQDDNDNPPVFSQSTPYIILADPTLTSGRFVGQVSATDADHSTTNNAIDYFIIDTNNVFDDGYIYVNSYGNLYVNTSWTSPTFDFDMIIEFEVVAQNMVDNTQTRLATTATVSLVLAATTTTSTSTTDRPADFIGDTRNVAWLTVAVGLASIVVIMLCLFVLYYTVSTKRYRWCCPACRRYLLNLTEVTKRLKIERYKNLMRREEEGLSSSSSSESSSSDSDSSSDEDTLPSAHMRVFKPWERNRPNANRKSADSNNFKPWTRSERL